MIDYFATKQLRPDLVGFVYPITFGRARLATARSLTAMVFDAVW